MHIHKQLIYIEHKGIASVFRKQETPGHLDRVDPEIRELPALPPSQATLNRPAGQVRVGVCVCVHVCVRVCWGVELD